MTPYQQNLQKEAEKLAKIITNQMDTVDGFGGFDALPESVKLQAIDRMKECARYVLEARAESYGEGADDFHGVTYIAEGAKDVNVAKKLQQKGYLPTEKEGAENE